MVKTVIPFLKRQKITNILLILSLIFSIVPANLVFLLSSDPTSLEKDGTINTLVDTVSHIPRLVATHNDNSKNSHSNGDNSSKLSESISYNNTSPTLAIGSQTGSGSGTYGANDSAILASNTDLDVEDGHWRLHPEEHENSITITIPSGYTNQSGYFNISEVTALPDWQLVENATTGVIQRQSDSFYEGAQEFKVDEADLNLTKVYLYIDMVDTNNTDNQKPNGEFLVVGDNSGEPDSTDVKGKITLETHSALAGLLDGGNWSAPTNSWLEYSISPAIHLTKGIYWLTLNDTSRNSGVGFWRWYTQSDGSGNPDKGEWNYKIALPNWFELPNVDMVIMPQVLPVELINSNYINKKYSSPQSIDFLYRTSSGDTNLTSFFWFEWNGTTDNTHYFLTNTSINLTLSWRINITYSNNPLFVSSSYLTKNDSITVWNLTFSTSSISTSYNILNRTIAINSLENNWNSTAIYLDNSLTFNTTSLGGINASVAYSNQSSSMIINAAALTAAKDWKVSLDAPNYLLNFTLFRNDTPLSLPYRIFNMNDYDLTFIVGETGNLTYWIDYPNGSQVLQKNNIDDSQTTITDIWDINSTLDQTRNVNGTYNLQAFWNNSDKTKVGTFTRNLDVFINTSLVVQAESQVVVGQLFNVTTYYKSVHNNSDIKNGIIYCESNWTDNVYMNQIADSLYNASFNTNDRGAGEIGTITITTLFPWYVNWTQEISVIFVRSTSIQARDAINNTLLTNTTSTYYRSYSASHSDNFSMILGYYDEITTSILNVTTDPLVESDDSILVYKKKDPISYNWTFEFNGSETGDFLINITFNLDNFLPSSFQIRYVISKADTVIISEISETNIVWNNSYDFALVVNNTDHNENITLYTTDEIDINDTTKVQFLNLQGDKYWFRFASTTLPIDTYNINITFFHNYLHNSSITVTLTVINRPTDIEAHDALNNNLLTNTTSTYYRSYSASHSDNFSIVASYYDQETGAILNMTMDPIVESDGSIFVYKKKDPVSYNWTFEFNGSMVGSFLVNITFSLDNYTSSTFQIRYVISKANTAIISEIDETNIVWNNSYDFALVVNNTDHNENITLYTTDEIDINDTIKVQFLNLQGDKYWFRFAPTTLPIDSYSVNITFTHTYFQTSFIIPSFTVINRPTGVETRDAFNNTLLNNQTSTYYRQYSALQSDNFSIILGYYDEETGSILNTTSDPLVESDGSVLVYTTKDPVSYNWTLIFNGTTVGSFLINITFSLDNYTAKTFQIRYVLSKADTLIISEINQTTFYWNESHDFALVVNNTNYNENITVYTSNNITIDYPNKVAFLNRTAERYWFRFASTALPVSNHDINITFSHTNYENSSILVSFTVINRPTGVEARDALNNTLLNNQTSTYYRQYSSSQSDNFSIILGYYDEETGSILNTTSDPLMESDGSVLVYITKDPVSYNWTLIFNGTIVGSFLVNITFSLDNYTATTFQIKYVLSKANTVIISEISQTSFYWNESYDFTLVVNNTNYNKNITQYTSTDIVIDYPAKVAFLNRTVEQYWFRFASTALPVGNHDINITFSHVNYEISSIIVSFTIINRPTGIEARDALNNTLLNNQTSTYYRQYSEGHSDNFTIILGYYDEETGSILNTTSDPLVESDDSILVYTTKDPVSYNWTFVFNGTTAGNFLINITLTLDNYTAATFQVRYIISKSDTTVISEVGLTSFYWNESYDFSLVINNTNYNENVTQYTSTNITIDYPAKTTFLNLTGDRYWFRFAPNALTVSNHDINISFSHNNFRNCSHLVSFTVINRPTGIEARDAFNNTLLNNETSTYYRNFSEGFLDNFSILINYFDNITGTALDVTSDPLVENDISVLVYTTKDPVSYNWTLIFNGTVVGSFLINITFTLDNYTTTTFQIRYILSKANTVIISEISKTSFYWNDSYDFALVVNNTNYNENVTQYVSTDITIEYPAKIVFLNRTGDRYWFRFASTALPVSNHDINITFSHLNFQNSSIITSFTVTNRPTGVEARNALNNTLLSNETSTYYRQYSAGHFDNFSIILSYYDEETGLILNTTSDPLVENDGSILVYSTKNPISYNWTLIFNGTAVGSFLINMTFTLDNYTSTTFQIRYILSKANTVIISEINQTSFYWNDSYDFALVVNNTNYNENVTQYVSTDITIEYPAKIVFLNRTGDRYWFRFASTALPVGNHDINITFSHANYQNISILVSFTVINRPTGIEARDAFNNSLLNNQTSTYYRQYSAGHSDNFSIILSYYDGETGSILNTTSDPPVESDGLILVYTTKDPVSYNWTLIFNGTAVGNFLINITFILDNYTAAVFQIRYVLSKADTAAISEIVQTSFYWNESYDFALVVNNTNYNENVSQYISTDISIDYPAKVVFLNRTADRYWFRFASTVLLVSNHDINITFSHANYQNISILVSFTVINRPTGIEARDAFNNSLLNNQTSNYYRQFSAGHFDNFSILISYYDNVTGISLNVTNDPIVESDGSVLVYATKDPVSYNWTLIFNGTAIGSFLINITFILDNYTAATFQVRYIISKADTAVISEISQTTFYWNESYDFALVVNNTNYNENVILYTSNDITIDYPTKIVFLNRTADRYWFCYAPSAVPLGIHDINVTFSHSYFQNSSIVASFTVINRPTGIEARDALNNTLLSNETSTYYRQYSAGHSDNFSIILGYYDEETGTILNTTSDPLVETDGSVLIYTTKDPASYNWILVFNGTAIGSFFINFTFTLGNYTAATFQVRYILSKADTAVMSEISQTTFYWNESYDFTLVVNNTNYNENITLYTATDITIDYPARMTFLNRTGERYWFRFAPTALAIGNHDINLTFSHSYFQNSSILTSFTVINRPTGVEARDALNNTLLSNETSTYYCQYSTGYFDSFSIIINYHDNTTGSSLNVTSDPTVDSDGSVLVYAIKHPINYNWTFVFNGTVVGNFLINITFTLDNYTAATFQVRYILSKADTAVISEISQTTFYWNESYDFTLVVNNSNYNENVTLYTNTNITINHPTKVTFLNRTMEQYWFRFAPSPVMLNTHDINITFSHTYFHNCSYLVSFTILPRPTNIEARDVLNNTLLNNETSNYYRQYSTGHSDNFSIIIRYYDDITGGSLNVTSDPNIESDGSVLVYATKDLVSYNWTFMFNGTVVGNFLINISFTLDNYTAAAFQMRYILLKADTAVISEISQTSFYWNEFYDFTLVVNNTDYNENVTLYTGTDITIDYPAKVTFLNRTAVRYWFRFAPSPVPLTIHTINISFSHTNFYNCSYLVSFTVFPRPTNIEVRDALTNTLLNNETSIYDLQYSTGHSDNFSIIIRYYDDITGVSLNVTSDPDVVSDGSVLVYTTKDPVSYNWTLIFNGTVVGNFLINLTFILDNYTTTTFQVRYILSKADTAVISEIFKTTFYWNESYDFALVVNNTNYNENVILYTSTDITTDYPAKIVFLNRTADRYWFCFAPFPVPLGIHGINITFSHSYFQNCSILISFIISSRPTNIEAKDALNNTLLNNETSTYYRQYSPNNYDNFSISIKFYDNTTERTLNVSEGAISIENDSTISVNYWKNLISYNWTFIFDGSVIGTYVINLTFNLANYTSVMFSIIYIIKKATTKVENRSIEPIPSINDVKSGETVEFWLIWQSTYNEPLNSSNGVMINSSDIILKETDLITGNHTFIFTRTTLGTITYNLTFIIQNYTKFEFIVRFNVFNRTMIITEVLSDPGVGQLINLSYGEIYFFNVFLNDSETLNPINASVLPTPLYILFLDIKNEGNHSFQFNASQPGKFLNLTIIFFIQNFETVQFNISFIVALGKMVLNASMSTHENDSVINILQYGEVYNFTIFLTDNRTTQPIMGIPISPLPTNIAFTGIATPGNHSFSYEALAVGTFTSLEIIISLPNYNNLSYLITFTVYNRDFLFNISLSTNENNSIVDTLQYGDVYNFTIFLTDNRTRQPIMGIPVSPLPTNIALTGITTPGNHSFSYEAVAVGTFASLEIIISLPNYNNLSYLITFIVHNRDFFFNVSLSTHNNDSIMDTLQYGDVYNFTIFLEDNRTRKPINGTPISPLPTNIAFTGIKSPGNHTFSYEATEVGTFISLEITFSLLNYNNYSYIITFVVHNRDFFFNVSLSTNENDSIVDTLQYGDVYIFKILLHDNRTRQLINGTPISPLPTNFAFTGITSPGNHTFSYEATEVGIFVSLKIIFSLPNYNNFSYLITFIVHNRDLFFNMSLSTNENNSIMDKLQYGDVYNFTIFLTDNRTRQPTSGIPTSPLPTNIAFTGITTPGNHSFSYEATAVGTFTSLEIIISLPNYNNLSYLITFIIHNREFLFNGSLLTHENDSIVNTLQYGDIHTFSIYLIDSQTGKPINGIPITLSPISFVGISSPGNHTFTYEGTEIGTFPSLEIQFTLLHYKDISYVISFIIDKRVFFIDEDLSKPVNNSDQIILLHYSEEYFFSVFLQDNQTKDPIIISPSSIVLPDNITFDSISSTGNYSFTFRGEKIVPFVLVVITFTQPNYHNTTYSIKFNITYMPTFTPEIQYQSELIVGEVLTISGQQWVTINNESVPIVEIQFLNRSTPISFSPGDVKEFPFTINIATEDFRQGFHRFTLILSSYGYENHSLSVPILIIGRDIQITISVIPEEIVQGSEFMIVATLKYIPLVPGNSGVGAAINLASLEGVEVRFTIDILYENGSSITSRYITETNATGSAIFTVDGKHTIDAEGIQSITVVSAATASGKAASQTTPVDFLEIQKFETQEEIDFSFILLLAFIGFLIVCSVLLVIGGTKVVKTRKQKIIDSKEIISTQDTSDIKREIPSSDEGIITRPELLQAETAIGTISKAIEETTIDTKITDVSTWMNLFPQDFSNFENEIKLIFNLVMKRKGRWAGQTSINYLVKNAPSEITTENLKILFTNLPKQTNYFKKERSLIILTSEGKKIALSILKEDKRQGNEEEKQVQNKKRE